MTATGAPTGWPPVPITILTGFLGAGKTTLLNSLLRQPALARAAVIVNEFGEIGIDHLLVDNVEGDMLVLTTGCICCAARGDLTQAIEDLLERRRAGRIDFDRIVIETTGIADPGPILNALLVHPDLWRLCSTGAVLTVVDVLGGAAHLGQHPEAMRQVAMADAIVLSKTDRLPGLADPARATLEGALRDWNPTAPILAAQDVDSVLAAMLDPALGLAKRLPNDPHAHHSRGHAHAALGATCLRAGVVQIARLQAFLDVLRRRHGPDLLRLKGIVATIEDPARPLVVHAVQHMIHPSRRLPAWPSDERGTRIVVVTKGVDPDSISELWNAFFGPPTIDRPDGAALLCNADDGTGLF